MLKDVVEHLLEDSLPEAEVEETVGKLTDMDVVTTEDTLEEVNDVAIDEKLSGFSAETLRETLLDVEAVRV